MPKPFRFAELLARVRLRLRQNQPRSTAPTSARTCSRPAASAWTCAPAGPRWTAEQMELSAREFTLAEIFMLNAGQVLSREQLLDHVWGYDFDPGLERRRRVRRLPAQEVRRRRDQHRPRDGLPVQRLTLNPASRPRGWAREDGLQRVGELVRERPRRRGRRSRAAYTILATSAGTRSGSSYGS